MATQSHAAPATILLTRPEEQSQRFAAEVRGALGEVDIVISPLMAPRFWQPALPSVPFAALLLTSQAGAEAARRISASGQPLPTVAYCVADRTAEVARAAGFTAISAQSDAAGLVAFLLAHGAEGPFLHLCGAETRGDVAQTLREARREATSLVCYDQVEQPLNASAKTILCGGRAVVAPLFSPRSARIFLRQVRELRATAPFLIAAMSAAVADVLLPWHPLRLEIAMQPNSAEMVSVVRALMQHKTSA